MAQYTMELNRILKYHEIFCFPYEIYDEKKRAEFEEAFKRHFYFREIGCDSVDQFIWYLRDKMTTVFPYYNELMRTATIEYDVENPYNLTETYTRKTDNKGKVAGFASSVGRSEAQHEQSGKNTLNSEHAENEHSQTENEGSETASGKVDREGTNQENNTRRDVKKFLDTPQGKVDLDSTDYLTNIAQDEGTGNVTQTSEGSETTANNKKITGLSDSSRSVNDTNVQNGTTENSETNSEQTTNDTNTRTESMGEQVEEYTMTRKGNIGVNPASYEIDSHIKTQKTLKRIYEMFFEECEDLFMLVY